MLNNLIKISRNQQMLHKVVIINGFPGCGKTMLSPIVSAFEHVEIMQYAPVIEQMCELKGLNRIDDDVVESMIRMNTDYLIYNVMMGRYSNCRPDDLSSIFRDNPLEHIRRMLGLGDENVLSVIQEKKPILHLTTHMLLPYLKSLINALGEKLIFIEVIRHPLYVIIQQEKNFKMFESSRNQHVRYTKNNKEYSYFTHGREKEFDNSNSYEKAIQSIDWYYSNLLSEKRDECIMLPFEKFVKQPEEYIELLSNQLEVPITNDVREEMFKQKVPREQLSDGPALDIYKRCGWTPPSAFSEEGELEARREIVANNVSSEALVILDDLSNKYEEYIKHGFPA
jgi:hypothetical protein